MVIRRAVLVAFVSVLMTGTGCGKLFFDRLQPPVAGDHSNPELPLFRLPWMEDRLFDVSGSDEMELVMRALPEGEAKFIEDLWKRTSDGMSYEQLASEVARRQQYGAVKVGDEVTLVCRDGSWPSKVVGFIPSNDELYETDIVYARLEQVAGAKDCYWAVHGARVRGGVVSHEPENLAGRPESAPILEYVRRQLMENQTGQLRAELERLKLNDPEYITYVRGSFPGAIDGIVIVERAPVTDPGYYIEQLDAMVFVDKAGKIVLTEVAPRLASRDESSAEISALLDVDKDGIQEVIVYDYYSEGGYTSLIYWNNGLPERKYLAGGGV